MTGTVRQRSSRTISSLRQSHDPDTAEEEETLVATDDVATDDTLDVDEDTLHGRPSVMTSYLSPHLQHDNIMI